MNLREKYAAAQQGPGRHLSRDKVQMNRALQLFTQSIPQIMQTAIDRADAGEMMRAAYDPHFKQSVEITDVHRQYRNPKGAVDDINALPSMQALKAYLSDPAIDIAFAVQVTGGYSYGRYVETLAMSVNPERPFGESMVVFQSQVGERFKAEMTAEDKNAWAAVLKKPKLSMPGATKTP